jgi:hypothetical protein
MLNYYQSHEIFTTSINTYHTKSTNTIFTEAIAKEEKKHHISHKCTTTKKLKNILYMYRMFCD